MGQPMAIRQIFTRGKLAALLNLGLAEFVRGSLLFFILPIYIRGILHFPAGIVGYAMAVHYGLDTSLRGPSGWLADRFGERKVAVSALSVGWVGLFLIARLHTDWSIISGCGLLGIGMAAIWPCVVSRVISGLPPEANATAMGGVMIAWLLGVGSGTVTMSIALGRHVASGFIALIVIWLAGMMLAFLALQGYRAEARHRKRLGLLDLIKSIGSVKLLIPGIFVQTFIMGIIMPVFVLYTQYQLGFSGRTYSALLITGGAATVLLQLPVGRMVDRFGYKPFLLSGFGACGVLLPVLSHARSEWQLFATIAGVGASYAFILPAWNSVLAHSVNERRRALMWGVFMTIEGLGMALGPLVGARLWQDFQPSTPFVVAGIILILMMLFYAFVPIEHAFEGSQANERGRRHGAKI